MLEDIKFIPDKQIYIGNYLKLLSICKENYQDEDYYLFLLFYNNQYTTNNIKGK